MRKPLEYFDGLETDLQDDDLLTEAYAFLLMFDVIAAPFRRFYMLCRYGSGRFHGM